MDRTGCARVGLGEPSIHSQAGQGMLLAAREDHLGCKPLLPVPRITRPVGSTRLLPNVPALATAGRSAPAAAGLSRRGTALHMAEFLGGVPRYPKLHPCELGQSSAASEPPPPLRTPFIGAPLLPAPTTPTQQMRPLLPFSVKKSDNPRPPLAG